MLLGVKKNGKF